ncbi:ankyrin repeat and SOCS box protein 9-like [Acipenser oxyrinchus oxyrinchus]|uniref:Ankyrin repeat and SOCS box protein 9-like n=1 Tax=Acipenser oxyrinchus oxyrinchus TaxID=40147 RepID=A0AAD8DDQ2_ACIOX|nr:ankyrin repeat and SOCS box protein 9-like [Acipenser oxyrinchus oxyrinchus]
MAGEKQDDLSGGNYFSNPLMSDFASDWSPVHDAALHGRLLALKTLIDQGSSVNLLTLDKVSPLHEACVGGNAACAKLLIEKGAKVNSATVDWNTPLFNACVSGNVACVNLLLQHGAKPQAEYHLSSPIHEAASRGHTECLEALLHHGADIDHNIKHLGTPLYVACTKQNLESVKKLLELGANLNTEGDTPLHAATRASRPDLVQLLLEHGADTKARNTEGKEALDLATPGSEARRILMQREGPPSLMQLCRLSVRKYLGRSRFQEISRLQIPTELKNFLLYRYREKGAKS